LEGLIKLPPTVQCCRWRGELKCLSARTAAELSAKAGCNQDCSKFIYRSVQVAGFCFEAEVAIQCPACGKTMLCDA
jgi:hypothetical protein